MWVVAAKKGVSRWNFTPTRRTLRLTRSAATGVVNSRAALPRHPRENVRPSRCAVVNQQLVSVTVNGFEAPVGGPVCSCDRRLPQTHDLGMVRGQVLGVRAVTDKRASGSSKLIRSGGHLAPRMRCDNIEGCNGGQPPAWPDGRVRGSPNVVASDRAITGQIRILRAEIDLCGVYAVVF